MIQCLWCICTVYLYDNYQLFSVFLVSLCSFFTAEKLSAKYRRKESWPRRGFEQVSKSHESNMIEETLLYGDFLLLTFDPCEKRSWWL